MCVYVCHAGVSLSSVVGMVAGHPNARSISLVRWGSSNLRDGDYIALLRAIGKVCVCVCECACVWLHPGLCLQSAPPFCVAALWASKSMCM